MRTVNKLFFLLSLFFFLINASSVIQRGSQQLKKIIKRNNTFVQAVSQMSSGSDIQILSSKNYRQFSNPKIPTIQNFIQKGSLSPLYPIFDFPASLMEGLEPVYLGTVNVIYS